MFHGRLDIHFCLVVGVLRHFQVFGRDGSLVVQQLGAVELRARQSFRRPALCGSRKGRRKRPVLCTRSKSCPFSTVSPAAREYPPRARKPAKSRAHSWIRRRSQPRSRSVRARPHCALAVASGNCSGWSTLTMLASCSRSTSAAGGASAAGFGCPLAPQPARRSASTRARARDPEGTPSPYGERRFH